MIDIPRKDDGKGRSLALRFVTITILGQAFFGIILGLGAGAYVVTSDYHARYTYMEDVAGAMAASVLPMVMDRDLPAVQGQLETLQSLAGRGDLRGIEFADATGKVLATLGELDPDGDRSVSAGIIESLFGPHYIEHQVAMNGVNYGTIRLMFAERTFVETFGVAMIVALLVTASVVLVSALWFSWLAVRTVIEPIQAIQVAAGQLANGKRDIVLGFDRNDEIGELGASIENLAEQLRMGEEKLREAAEKSREAQVNEARLREKTEEMARLKSDFVAVVAHELGTPLSVVTLYSDILGSSKARDVDKDTAEVIEGLIAAASRLNSIVNDLMDAALLDRGMMRIAMRPLNFVAVVQEASKDAMRMAQSHGITVREAAQCSEEMTVLADKVRIRQVMDNLLSNAIKYSPAGATVSVRCFTVNGAAVLEVADEGPGIHQSDSSQVFEIFGRLDHRDNRDTAGLGLGLAISAKIAQAHGATLGFEPGSGGVGTIFTLKLPILDDDDVDHCRSTEVSIVNEAGDEGSGQ